MAPPAIRLRGPGGCRSSRAPSSIGRRRCSSRPGRPARASSESTPRGDRRRRPRGDGRGRIRPRAAGERRGPRRRLRAADAHRSGVHPPGGRGASPMRRPPPWSSRSRRLGRRPAGTAAMEPSADRGCPRALARAHDGGGARGARAGDPRGGRPAGRVAAARARAGSVLAASAALAAVALGARAVLWFALAPVTGGGAPPVTGRTTSLLTALGGGARSPGSCSISRRGGASRARVPGSSRTAAHGGRRSRRPTSRPAQLAAWGLWTYARVLRGLAPGSALDVIHFALHPPNPSRLALAFALLLLHASAVWAAGVGDAAAGARVADAPRVAHRHRRAGVAGRRGARLRARRTVNPHAAAGRRARRRRRRAAWQSAGRTAACTARRRRRASCGNRSASWCRPSRSTHCCSPSRPTRARRSSPARTRRRSCACAKTCRTACAARSTNRSDGAATTSRGAPRQPGRLARRGAAFAIWSRTDLGDLPADVGRRAVRRGRPAGQPLRARTCPSTPRPVPRRELQLGRAFDEMSPFGAERAARAPREPRASACAAGMVGAIVVRVMLDYRTLPFISSAEPYLESLRARRAQAPTRTCRARRRIRRLRLEPGADLTRSAAASGRCPTGVFDAPGRVARAVLGDARPRRRSVPRLLPERSRRHLRARLPVDHARSATCINLAELVMLDAARCTSLLLGGATLFSALTSRATGASGRALLREVRSSFYRKLFLALLGGRRRCRSRSSPFVIAHVLRDAARAPAWRTAAAQTATVAQRLVEDYAALQQRGRRARARSTTRSWCS